MDVPLIITLVVPATAMALVGAITLMLARGPGVGPRSRQWRTAVATGGALLAWLIIGSLLAVAGAFHTPATPPVLVYPLVALPLLGLLAVRTVPTLRRHLERPSPRSDLVGLHVWRYAGGVFLIMAALGRMPWLFALPAGLGDIAVAIMAPGVSRRLRSGAGRRSALAWNAFGLLDLVVALGLGAATSPGPLQVFSTNPSSELLSAFPLVLFPIFLVPVSLLAHLLSVRSLISRHATRDPAIAVGSA